MRKTFKLSQADAQERLAEALSREITDTGVLKAWVKGTGLGERSLRDYANGASAPHLGAFLTLCSFGGPTFTNDVMGLIDYEVRPASPVEIEYPVLLSRMAQPVAALAEALADGHVDHREKRVLAPLLAELGSELTSMADAMLHSKGDR